MNTEELLQEITEMTLDSYEKYVKHNIKANQLSWAKGLLKEKVDNLGDVGMAIPYKMMIEAYENEKQSGERLSTKYYVQRDMLLRLLNMTDDPDSGIERYECLEKQVLEKINREWKQSEVDALK